MDSFFQVGKIDVWRKVIMASPCVFIAACSLFGKDASAPKPTRPPEAIMAEAHERLQQYPESRVTVSDGQDGKLILEGRVATEKQQQALQQELKGIAGVVDVQDKTEVVPPSLQETLILLKGYQPQAEGASKLDVHPQKGCDQVYYQAEPLVVDVLASRQLDYLYVDYYMPAQGVVLHLFPSEQQPHNPLSQTSSLNLGGPDSPAQWRIQEPFGLELLTVISSPVPLFLRKRSEQESISAYIDTLRKTLSSFSPDRKVTAWHCFLSSAAKQSTETSVAASGASEDKGPTPLPKESEKKSGKAEQAALPAKTHEAKASLVSPTNGAPAAVTFLDTSGFDTKLSSSLKQNPQDVAIDFSAPISVNSIPPRLEKWLAVVEKSGGAITVQPDPAVAEVQRGFFESIIISLAITAYEAIQNKRMYGPAENYDAIVYCGQSKGDVTKVVFKRR